MIQIVSGLVRELVSVESWALVKNGLLKNKRNSLKKGSQILCKDHPYAAARTVKREEGVCDLFPLSEL